MVDEGLAYTPASDLLELIASKQVSPVDLAEMYLQRIDRLDPQLNSFLLVTRDLAMEQARAAEDAVMRGDELGPLHGLPVPIKDTQMTAGVPSTMGSVVFQDRVPEGNAAVVERILQAGAVMPGKTNVPEFGMVGTCENSLGVLGRNPWNSDRTPGGSSGGAAAAVAAGLCPAATGSDGGGSLRIPANFCGIYTIKPTQGRVSGYTGLGGPPLPNIFSQAGPLTRTVRDSAILLPWRDSTGGTRLPSAGPLPTSWPQPGAPSTASASAGAPTSASPPSGPRSWTSPPGLPGSSRNWDARWRR